MMAGNGKAMGEALSISFSRISPVRSSGDPLIELLTFYCVFDQRFVAA